jgi:hypothetical protein
MSQNIGYTEFLVGPGRARDRAKIPACIRNTCKTAVSEQRKLAKVQIRTFENGRGGCLATGGAAQR